MQDSTRDRDFPGLRDRIYLNTAAEGIPPIGMRDALASYAADKAMGMEGRDALFAEFAECRQSATDLLGLTTDEVSFCSSTSEAYNLLANAVDFGDEGEAVITNLDFPSGVTPWVATTYPSENSSLESPQRGARTGRPLGETQREHETGAGFSGQLFDRLSHSLGSISGSREGESSAGDSLRRRHASSRTRRLGLSRCRLSVCFQLQMVAGIARILCLVVVPSHARDRITVRAGGWYNLANAFDDDRFSRAEPFPGAAGFAVGMPAFPAIYALRRGIDLIKETGVPAIATHADTLLARVHEGLSETGFETMSPAQPGNSSGIVSFQTTDDAVLNEFLLARGIHVMHQAGRIRISIHGYNTDADIDACLDGLREFRKTN